jgi:hypothetical protein
MPDESETAETAEERDHQEDRALEEVVAMRGQDEPQALVVDPGQRRQNVGVAGRDSHCVGSLHPFDATTTRWPRSWQRPHAPDQFGDR